MSYKKLGKYIKLIDNRNKDLSDAPLLGVSVQKRFITSIANTIGSDMSKYKLIEKNNFTYIADTSRRGDKIGIALLKDYDKAMISQAYTSFKITDENELSPDYLMMWFSRPEFDRYARYHSIGSVREVFDWKDMCEVELPIPSIEEQRQIVAQYQSIANKIKVNEQICEKLEATAQALYKHWFVDFEFPNEEGKAYKSSGGKMVWNEELGKEIPEGWNLTQLGLVSKIVMGQSPEGESYNESGIGIPLVNGPVEFGNFFTVKSKWTTEPKKYCKAEDFIMCVRGSTVGRYVISDDKYAIGRGVCSISNNNMFHLSLLIKNNLFEILKDVTGSTFPNLDRQTLENYKVIEPIEQIKEQFESDFKSLDKSLKIMKKQNRKLTQLQSLLLSRLAVGEEVNA